MSGKHENGKSVDDVGDENGVRGGNLSIVRRYRRRYRSPKRKEKPRKIPDPFPKRRAFEREDGID